VDLQFLSSSLTLVGGWKAMLHHRDMELETIEALIFTSITFDLQNWIKGLLEIAEPQRHGRNDSADLAF
jgi:hypothetical protein